ncbi:MAG: hypothetical protein HY881_25680 [Deltaproteobacteria bacterium]|nr:hypothetical protein [Deltaproteobacteria bacterium]
MNLEPIYLQTPKRIEALLFLFEIALQMAVLIERSAREKIKARDKGLDNFMPNRKNVKNPTTENLLAEFKDIVKGIIELPSGETFGFVSKLTDIQKDILAVSPNIISTTPICLIQPDDKLELARVGNRTAGCRK